MLFFLRDNIRWLGAGFAMLFASSFGQTFFISLSGGEIRRDLDLTDGEFGLIYMGVTLASALSLVSVGKLADTKTLRILVAMSAAGLCIGAVALSSATSLIVLIASMFLLRLFGQGMMVHIAYTAIGRWFAADRGRAVSISALGLNTGQALLPLLAVAGIAGLGWRNLWLIVAAFILVFMLPLFFSLLKRERVPTVAPVSETARSSKNWMRKEVLRDPYFYGLMLGMLPPAFISSTIFFHQVHLMQSRDWPLETFASAFVVYAVVAVSNALLSGYLVDRFSALRLLPFYLFPFGVGCILLGVIDAPWVAFAFMVLYGISDGFSLTLFGSLWPEVYGVKFLGSIRAVIVAIMVFASAVGPGIAGVLIDRGVPFTSQIMVMGVYCVLICGLLLSLTRHIRMR